jgi:hypothetical protein
MASNLSQLPAKAGGQGLINLLEKEIRGENDKWYIGNTVLLLCLETPQSTLLEINFIITMACA